MNSSVPFDSLEGVDIYMYPSPDRDGYLFVGINKTSKRMIVESIDNSEIEAIAAGNDSNIYHQTLDRLLARVNETGDYAVRNMRAI